MNHPSSVSYEGGTKRHRNNIRNSVVAKADLVVAQEDVIGKIDRALKELLQQDIMQGPRPLAINAVGGTASDLLFRLLSPGGTHVTYWGHVDASRHDRHVAFDFSKDVRSLGYWHSRYMMQQRTTLEAYLDGHLTPPPVIHQYKYLFSRRGGCTILCQSTLARNDTFQSGL